MVIREKDRGLCFSNYCRRGSPGREGNFTC